VTTELQIEEYKIVLPQLEEKNETIARNIQIELEKQIALKAIKEDCL